MRKLGSVAVLGMLMGFCCGASALELAAAPECKILQESGVMADGQGGQRHRLVLGECKTVLRAWLVDTGAVSAPLGPGKVLDVHEFGNVRTGLSLDLSAGNCSIGHLPLKQTVLLLATWRGRKEIRRGSGIEEVWRADMKSRKLVAVETARMVCREDEP
jgi:hypothetical protein